MIPSTFFNIVVIVRYTVDIVRVVKIYFYITDFSFPLYTASAMFLNRSEYDRGPNTFSPEGRLFQVEYAIEAIKLGSTAIGIQTS